MYFEELYKKLSQKDETLGQKIDSISKRLLDFYEKYKKENIRTQNLKMLQKYINSSIGILKTSNFLYIPILGVSNAGKSTILNDLIGCSILPTQQNECTKKGILIKYWENEFLVIRKTKFIKEELGDEIIYYFKPEENITTIGLDDIHRVLEGTNGEFTDNTEDYFYEIDINIKFVREELNVDESMKNKICFIDLPGFGTNNAFEQNEIYSHLIKSCNIFLFIVFNLKIKETDNKKMLDNLIKKMSSFRGIISNSFVDKCLFIVNCDKDQKINEKSEEQAKKDIQSILSKDAKNSKNNLPLNIKFIFFKQNIMKVIFKNYYIIVQHFH
jgi:GTP-binding protein EngB required for normal cell division